MSDSRTATRITEQEAQSQLRDALAYAGVDVARVGMPILDGQHHYVPLVGQRGKEVSAGYRVYYDGIRPAGSIMNYRDGTKTTWKADGQIVHLTDAERRSREQQTADLAAQREQQRIAREDTAARAAQALLADTKPASPDHPYLVRKGIEPHGARQDDRGNLVIPLHDVATGELRSLQTIAPDGSKRYLGGAQKTGVAYVMGELQPDRPLLAVEGFATAASVREATGHTVAMALDAGNLKPVAVAFRALHPEMPIAFPADNDAHLPVRVQGVHKSGPRDNAGLDKAQDAADAVGGRVMLAPEMPERTRADQGTDWNDVALARGREAVAVPFHAVLPRLTPAAPVLETPAVSDTIAPPVPPPVSPAIPVPDAAAQSIARRETYDAEAAYRGMGTLAEHQDYADRVGRAVARGAMTQHDAATRIERRMTDYAVQSDPSALRTALTERVATVARDAARLSPDAQTVHEAISVVVDSRLASEPATVRDAIKADARVELERQELVHGPVTLTPDIRIAAGKPPEPETVPVMRAHDMEDFAAMARAVRDMSATPDRIAPPDAAETRKALTEMFDKAISIQALTFLYKEGDVRQSIRTVMSHPDEADLLRDAMKAAETRLLAARVHEKPAHTLPNAAAPPAPAAPTVSPPSVDADAGTPALTITRRGDNGGPGSVPPTPDAPKPAAPASPAGPAPVDTIARDYTIRERGEERHYHQRSDGAHAMTTTDQRIDGVLRDAKTISAMLDIAAQRGWTEIQVRGDMTVARDTWIEATARGLKVEGYGPPTRDDRHAVDQRRLDRVAQGLPVSPLPEQRASVREAPTPAREARDTPSQPERSRSVADNEVNRHTPAWATRDGGYDALSPKEQLSAQRAYASWAERYPDLGAKYPMPNYVEYAQTEQAKTRQELAMPPPKLDTPRQSMTR